MQRVCHKIDRVAPTVTCGAVGHHTCMCRRRLLGNRMVNRVDVAGACMLTSMSANSSVYLSSLRLFMRLARGSGEGAIVDSEKADARHRSLGRVFAIGARGRSIGHPTDVSRYTSALSEQLSATGVSSVQRQHEVRGAAMHAPSASSRITCSSSIVLRRPLLPQANACT